MCVRECMQVLVQGVYATKNLQSLQSHVVGALGAAVGWDGALLDQTIQSFGPLGLANIDQFDVHIKHQNTSSAENHYQILYDK